MEAEEAKSSVEDLQETLNQKNAIIESLTKEANEKDTKIDALEKEKEIAASLSEELTTKTEKLQIVEQQLKDIQNQL